MLFNSCDETEPIPSYVYIESIQLETPSGGSEGSNSSDIVDAWVYIDNEEIGVFELPARIPILKQGKQTIKVLAGIKKNGIANERITYPFYQEFEQEIDMVPSEIDTLKPVLKYRSICKFVWLEDFEDGTFSLVGSGSVTTNDSLYITSDPTEVFEYTPVTSTGSGKVVLDTGFQIFENSSSKIFDLPRSGQEIFLEFDYKSESEFVVGIYPLGGTVVTGTPVVNYFGSNEWKKAYVSLKEDVNSAQNLGLDFKVFFNMRTNSNEKHTFLIDNIKLIHF